MSHRQSLQCREQSVHIDVFREIGYGRHEVPDVISPFHPDLRLFRRVDLHSPHLVYIKPREEIKRAGGRVRTEVFEQKDESEKDHCHRQPEPGILGTHVTSYFLRRSQTKPPNKRMPPGMAPSSKAFTALF